MAGSDWFANKPELDRLLLEEALFDVAILRSRLASTGTCSRFNRVVTPE